MRYSALPYLTAAISAIIVSGMKPKDLLSVWKTQREAAAALGVTQPAVAIWFMEGRIPYMRQFQIASITGLPVDEKPAPHVDVAQQPE
jgi:hypothetical protein